jgi:hypothetical protein
MKQSCYGLGLAVSVFSITTFSQTAAAAVFNVGQLTWDSDNAVTSGQVIQGNVSAFAANFLVTDPNVNLITNQTIGSVLGLFPGANTSVDLGNATNRGIIELNWGNRYLKNSVGNDFAIYENGFAGEPEAFAVAVRKRGETDFSNFLYKFTTEFVQPNVFATVFDLSDFNLGQGEAIDAIRIANLLLTDRVTGEDGQGFLGGTFLPITSPGGSGFDINKFDADITYVVALNTPTAVPEPSSLLGFLVLGGIGLLKKCLGK